MKQNFKTNLTNLVKKEREIRRITSTEFAKYLGISRQTLNLLERGDYNPSLYLALKISRVLHQPVEYLFRVN